MQELPEDEKQKCDKLNCGWADSLAVLSAVFFCLCGLIAMALDAIHGFHSGRFTIVSNFSIPVMKWLYSVGLCVSLVAYVGYPQRMALRVAVLVLCPLYAAATAFCWFLCMHPI